MHYAFPADSVECKVGDYLLCLQPDTRWHVYRVDDIVAVRRLVPSATSPVTLSPEDTLLDSLAPAYFGAVYLLLTFFDPVSGDEAAARQAIRNKLLGEHLRGLLRSARDFPKDACKVVAPAEA